MLNRKYMNSSDGSIRVRIPKIVNKFLISLNIYIYLFHNILCKNWDFNIEIWKTSSWWTAHSTREYYSQYWCAAWPPVSVSTYALSAPSLGCPAQRFPLLTLWLSPPAWKYIRVCVCDTLWRPHDSVDVCVPIWFFPGTPYRWGSSTANWTRLVVRLWFGREIRL